MIRSIRSSLAYKIFLILIAVILFYALIAIVLGDPNRAAIGDSVQYWAAAKLMVSGENPYSAPLVLDLRHQVGNFSEFSADTVSMMLYPPWAIPLFLTGGWLDYQYFRMVWLLVHICLVFVSTWLIWNLYQGPRTLLWLAYLVAFAFEPTILVLGTGHITTLYLLGLIGFLYFIRKNQDSWVDDVLAGACLGFVTIKPQLLVLFLLVVFLWVIHQRRLFIVLGLAASLMLLSLISLAYNSAVFSQYWVAISQYPLGAWATPTIGGVLRLLFGVDKEWLQVLPTLVGVIWILFYWWSRRDTWDWKEETPLLVLVSILVAAYTWTYDMVVLLLPVLQVVILSIRSEYKWLPRLLLFSYFAVSIFALVSHIYMNEFWFFWFPSFILVWYLLGRNLSLRQRVVVESV